VSTLIYEEREAGDTKNINKPIKSTQENTKNLNQCCMSRWTDVKEGDVAGIVHKLARGHIRSNNNNNNTFIL